jgi:tight adherence protein C
MIMLLVLGAACLGGAIFLAAEALGQSRRELQLSIARAARRGRAPAAATDVAPAEAPSRSRFHFSAAAASLVMRLSPRTTLEGVAFRLARAGLSSWIGPHEYLAFRLAFGAGGVAIGMVLGIANGNAALAASFGVLFGAFGFFGPELVVRARLRVRREAIRAALPDALDLLTVSVEAGLGLDAALVRLTETTKGPLSDELTILIGQISVGEGRAEAFRALAHRVDAPEIAGFARAVVQADQLGLSLGRTLRLQASEVRQRRQAIAEERAAKTPVKMIFPLVFCIFPTLFVIVLGPPLLRLLHGL